jgi:hypothetical protein
MDWRKERQILNQVQGDKESEPQVGKGSYASVHRS